MPATSHQIEAVKLIGEWSKWVAAVGTGAIAVIGSLIDLRKDDPPLPLAVTAFYTVAVACFVLSVLCAAGVLLSLPAAVQDMKDGDLAWDRVATLGPFFPLLRHVVATQLLMFGIGIISFGGGVITSMVEHPPSSQLSAVTGKLSETE